MSDAPSDPAPEKSGVPKLIGSLVGLIKRPIEYGLIGAAAVLVIALADALNVLPLKFKGLGTEVEFGTKEKTVLKASADQIAALEGRVQKLQRELAQVVANIQDGERLDVTTAAVVSLPEDAGNVSKAVLIEDKLVEGTGAIWLGTYDPIQGQWTDRSVTAPGGGLPDPGSLNGVRVSFDIDVNVRADLPEPNVTYYSDIPKKGVARRGFDAKIIGEPVRYVRPTGVQYWSEVALSFVEAQE